jgi:hypothetical protein
MKPGNVNILGVVYTIEYVSKPSDVDIFKRESYWGQIDYWTRTIRVYDNGTRPLQDIWETVIHEVLHGIAEALHIGILTSAGCSTEDKKKHDELDVLSLALVDTFVRNGWLKLEDEIA